MRINKILSLLVAFIMICTLIPCMTSAEEVEEPTFSQKMKYDTVVGLGIMSTDQDGNFLPETAVTSGELANIISAMFVHNTLTLFCKVFRNIFIMISYLLWF